MKRVFLKGMFLSFYFATKVALGNVAFDFHEPTFNGGTAFLVVVIAETVTPEDYANVTKIGSLMQQRFGDNWAVMARLDSTGGNVSAALRIGRFLRKKRALANVEEDAVCLSSCVYILAGAPTRIVEGKVGIHRPYEPNDRESSQAVQKEKYKKIGKEIVDYLHEMNIPTRLYEDSLFISPDRVKMLTSSELQGYGLNENDPYEDEANAVREAKRLGITRKEYATREARAHGECGLNVMSNETPKNELVRGMECRTAILEGRR